jgi:iron-sulfur cluster assembly accessory protein
MIQLSERAQRKVRQMIQADGRSGVRLRIYVEGGGCSGMQYGLQFDEELREDDERFDCGGFQVVVDRMSLPFLAGTTLDYKDALMDGGFKIQNPQAKTTCGCGQSFST